MQPEIYIKDQDDVLSIRYADLVRYHGYSYIAGVAMAFQLLRFAFSRLTPGWIPCRQEISVRIGVKGPGIIDGIEMVTRAQSRQQLQVDPIWAWSIEAPDAVDGVGGKYCFAVTCGDTQLCFTLRKGLLPQRFLDLSRKVHDRTIVPEEEIELKDLKNTIAKDLLRQSPEELFEITAD